MFIVFEGVDGTGKSTQVKLLSNALKALGYSVTTSFEPTNGTYGKILRNSAMSENGRFSAEEELELFIKDRKEHLENLILPALERDEVVILDRYYFSNMAYQGARGLEVSEIRKQNESFARKPDILIVFTQPVDVSLARIGIRDGQGNAFETRDALERCAEIFSSLDDPFVYFIDSDREADRIHEDVRRLVTGLMM